ncbi:MAG TPA: MerR family DNA-binding transcriptional regulator [Elusimicrobia bacterium]|nr:MerR family DNA-binding transcriptional regulator [Elusimicrobiota bacterium]
MASPNLKNYLTVSQAAKFLGVSPNTLRNWDKAGKLKAYRQPISGYRLYQKSELARSLKRLAKGKRLPVGYLSARRLRAKI